MVHEARRQVQIRGDLQLQPESPRPNFLSVAIPQFVLFCLVLTLRRQLNLYNPSTNPSTSPTPTSAPPGTSLTLLRARPLIKTPRWLSCTSSTTATRASASRAPSPLPCGPPLRITRSTTRSTTTPARLSAGAPKAIPRRLPAARPSLATPT